MQTNARPFLQPEEEILQSEGRHPVSIIPGLVVAFLLLGLLAAVATIAATQNLREPERPLAVAAAWTIAALAWLLIAFIRWRIQVTSRYVLTHDRVYASYGRILFNLVQTTHDRVTDLVVRQGPIARAFGFGDVRVMTAGLGVRLTGVRAPFETKQRIEEARIAFIQGLVGKARTQAASTQAPSEAPATTRMVWTGRPTIESMFGRLLSSFGTILTGAALLAIATATSADQLYFIGGGLLVFGLISASTAYLRYKFTTFEVTSRGLAISSGWLSRRRVETTFDKITDVTINESLLGRILGYGRLTANTAGGAGAPIMFDGLRQPEEVKRTIEAARLGRWGEPA